MEISFPLNAERCVGSASSDKLFSTVFDVELERAATNNITEWYENALDLLSEPYYSFGFWFQIAS